MKILRSTTVILCLALGSPSVHSQDNMEWIVTGSDAASLSEAYFAKQPLLKDGQSVFKVSESKEGRAVAQIFTGAFDQLSDIIHTNFRRCGGYTIHDTREAAIQEANNPFYSRDFTARRIFFPKINQPDRVREALNLVSRTEIIDTIRALESLGTRYYETKKGQEAAIMLEKRWSSYDAAASDFSVVRFEHGEWRQDSVIATIRGTKYPDEIVVVGAHLDSINLNDNNNAPGADDDASGVAVISETLRVLRKIKFKPERTLQFMAYAAEEVGLQGSREIAVRYKEQGKKVIGALQFDLAGYPGSEKNMYFVVDDEYVNKGLTEYSKKLIGKYNNSGLHEITYSDTRCGYACSDHVSWTGVGVPAAFVTETAFDEFNKKIHTDEDTLDNIDTTGIHQARFAKLGVEFMIEMAKGAGSTGEGTEVRAATTHVPLTGTGSDGFDGQWEMVDGGGTLEIEGGEWHHPAMGIADLLKGKGAANYEVQYRYHRGAMCTYRIKKTGDGQRLILEPTDATQPIDFCPSGTLPRVGS